VSLCGSSGDGGDGVRTAIANGYFGPISLGQTLTTLPGAKVGPLAQGFADRMSGTDNPTNFDPSDPRAVLVPLVSGFSTCSGTCSITVTGFMAFYIDSYAGGAISGHFIKMAAIDAAGNPTVTTDAGVQGDPILIK